MDKIEIHQVEGTLENYLHDCRIKIGETIREIREKRGYNQEQLAEIIKVITTSFVGFNLIGCIIVNH